MPGITLEQAEARLAEYLEAEAAVLARQAYTIGGRQLTMANLSSIQEGIKLWNDRAAALGAVADGRGRLRTLVPKA